MTPCFHSTTTVLHPSLSQHQTSTSILHRHHSKVSNTTTSCPLATRSTAPAPPRSTIAYLCRPPDPDHLYPSAHHHRRLPSLESTPASLFSTIINTTAADNPHRPNLLFSPLSPRQHTTTTISDHPLHHHPFNNHKHSPSRLSAFRVVDSSIATSLDLVAVDLLIVVVPDPRSPVRSRSLLSISDVVQGFLARS